MDPTAKLIQQKNELLAQLAALGPMRKGTLSEQYVQTTLKDGTPSRRGPYTVYTFKAHGRTLSQRLSDRARIALYREQIATFRRFQELSAELLRVGQQLADRQAAGEEGCKKKLQALIQSEKEAETARIIERLAREGSLDLEGAEFYVRTAVLALGAGVLERLLHEVGVGRQAAPRQCARGHLPRQMESTGVRVKTIQTILGPVRFARSRYVCPACGQVEYPGDELLGVEGTGFSPGMRRLMTHAGSRQSFREAGEDLRLYGAIHAHPKDVERQAEAMGRRIEDWMGKQASAAMLQTESQEAEQAPIAILYAELDGTGAPMRKGELLERRTKGKDGEAKTNEVKLGCFFTQTTLDEEGRPVRDEDSTHYVGAIEKSRDFGQRYYAEAVRCGLRRAARVVVLSDGAAYNRTIAEEHFPQATHIIDLYHARERLAEFVKGWTAHALDGGFHTQCLGLLDEGRIEELTELLRQELPSRGKRRGQGLKKINYFGKRAAQMRYGEFRRQGLFVGSGVIEAGCKTLIGKRLKNSGMFWSRKGANAIIAARCCLYSGRFEDFWADIAA
jgi:hypothetical protein